MAQFNHSASALQLRTSAGQSATGQRLYRTTSIPGLAEAATADQLKTLGDQLAGLMEPELVGLVRVTLSTVE